jgi:hypothetical protein
MKSTSKKGARPTTKALNDDPDPLGFAAKLEEAYYAQLHAILRKNLIVGLPPPVLRRIVDVGTAQGEPVTVPLTITVHPREASGFALVFGELDPFYLPLDPSSRPSLPSLFPEEPVRPPVRPKRRLGKGKRKLGPGTGPHFSIFDR